MYTAIEMNRVKKIYSKSNFYQKKSKIYSKNQENIPQKQTLPQKNIKKTRFCKYA